MVATQSRTKNRGAGAARVSSRSSSRARGQSAADAAKQPTSLNDFAAALDTFTPRERLNGNMCPVKRMSENVPPEMMVKIHTIVDNKNIVAKQVEDFFRQWESVIGIRVNIQSIWKHRRRDCTCPKN